MGARQSPRSYSNAYNNPMYSSHAGGYGGRGKYPPADNSNISCVIAPINGVGGLYLGDIQAAEDFQMLQRLGIKAVITAARQADLHYDHSIVPYHLIVNARDSNKFNIAQYFDQAVNFLKQCLASTNVLIHCMAGVSRSATLTIAYLIAEKGMNIDAAFNYVRQCRPVITPNSGFFSQLKEYQMVIAQRMMYNHNSGGAAMMSSSPGLFSRANLNSMNNLDQINYYPGQDKNRLRVSKAMDRQNYYY